MHGFRSKVILSIWICIFCFCTAGNCKHVFSIESDSNIQPISATTELSNDGFIYFGRPSCAFCQKYEKYIQIAAEETGSTVYYFDTDSRRETEAFQAILDQYQVTQVPALFYQKGSYRRTFTADESLSDPQLQSRISTFFHIHSDGFYQYYTITMLFVDGLLFIIFLVSLAQYFKKIKTSTFSSVIPITVILLSNIFFIFSTYYLGAYIDRWNLSGISILFPALIHLLLTVGGFLLQLMNIKRRTNP